MRRVIIAAVLSIVFITPGGARTREAHRVYLPLIGVGKMRMARFGDTYAGGYVFGLARMEDSWKSTRPPVVQRVGGASGAFDFYGDNNFPVAPVLATKKFALTSSVSSAAIEDALMTLRATTIAVGRTKLWWLDRDNTTIYWSWAKCTLLDTADTYKERGQWLKVVTLQFYMSEGVWYGETQGTRSITVNAFGAGATSFTIAGNAPSALDVTITPSAGNTVRIGADCTTGSEAEWEFTGTVISGNALVVNASTYVVTNNAVDAYVGLTVLPQIPFLYQIPGSWTLITLTRDGVSAGVAASGTLTWWDTYVF